MTESSTLTKNIQLKAVDLGEYLYVRASGQSSVKQSVSLISEVNDLLKINRNHFLLINIQEVFNRMNNTDAYFFIKEFHLNDVSVDSRIAVVDLPQNKENNGFFELASKVQGFSIKFYYNENEAINWLCHSKD